MYKDEKPTREIEPALHSAIAEKHGIAAFELFCAYHLGVTKDDGYEFQNVHQVAKRFGVPSGVIKQALQEFGMDSDRLIQSDFDLAAAQVDVMNVPDGVSRTEVARTHWEAFRNAHRKQRDWRRELAEDAVENERVFGLKSATSPPPTPSRAPPRSSSPAPSHSRLPRRK